MEVTEQELDALQHDLRTKCPYPAAGNAIVIGLLGDAATAITTLRAQLAEARADLTFMTENRNKWQDSATQRWFRIEEANARADRAEAALAAQIEVEPVAWVIPGDDNEDCNGFIDAMAYEDGEFTRPLYAAQPHSRTALDAAIRAAKVEALKKAADLPKRTEKLGGQNYAYVRVEEIIALIEREGV